ncbi:hypothetical protein THARTR1_04007 [Trichoderma harzianum]|uniref:Myb-like domain-containing protein n=1 Tax=Trichoderma harzianum TaxID=5544 RepID=A0A2K0UDF1_TRIHA|nr:hypothetical protein THARTR1_04007 [Trichoderma harzianum]
MDTGSQVHDKVEASLLQDESENLTGQSGTGSSISEPINSNPQDEADESSVPILVRRALAAGRTPLPTSRPPIKAIGMHIADPGRTTRESSYDSQGTELDQPSETDQKQTAKGKALRPASHGHPKAKNSNTRPKGQKARASFRRVQRRKWILSDIKSLIRMREDKMSWQVIAGSFSNRTVDGVRQTFFKYKPLFQDMKSGEE